MSKKSTTTLSRKAAATIAEKHGVTPRYVYQIKKTCANAAILADIVAELELSKRKKTKENKKKDSLLKRLNKVTK